MTDNAIDYNIGKFLYLFNQKVEIVKEDNSARWFLDRLTLIMDYNGAPRDSGPIHLEDKDFREVKEYAKADIVREYNSPENERTQAGVPGYEPSHLGVIVIQFNGYNIPIYKVKNLSEYILPLINLNTVNK